MKKTNKTAAILIGSLAVTMLFSGCGKKKETKKSDNSTIEISPVATMDGSAEDIVIVSRDGYVLSDLTGEWIEEEYANQKPLCIMINNISEAMPQSGLSQAAVTYEILVEGGITRYLCVFDRYDNIEKLGPIRSARVPYVQLAKMYDGLFAHYGWSPSAQEMIEGDPSIDTLNGIYLGEIMYYRDPNRAAPHDVYTNSDLIASGIDNKGYDTKHNDSYEKMFDFNLTDKPLNSGKTANKVITAFSDSRTPRFFYHDDDKLYYREQYGEEQIDAETGNQLSYKNVLVLLVEYTTDADVYYKFVSWDRGGQAYYFTDGEYIVVNWKYEDGTLKYYKEDGTPLKLNPGRTFVTVFDYTISGAVMIE